MVDKPYNNGQWSHARFQAFIKSALRSASNRWGPKISVKKKARIKRGIYECAGYSRSPHHVPASIKKGNRRLNNALVDHILPIVDPVEGFHSWDKTVARMFVEEDGLQVLCKSCHDAKTADERKARNDERRRRREV